MLSETGSRRWVARRCQIARRGSQAYRLMMMGSRSRNYERALREANKAFRTDEEPRPSRGDLILTFGILLFLMVVVVAY